MELPVWVSSDEFKGLHHVDNARAIAAGLTFRPLEETARATLEEAETNDDAGMKPERERELLAAWAASPRSSESPAPPPRAGTR